MSTAKLVVAAGPGTGGTGGRWAHTASANRDHLHLGGLSLPRLGEGTAKQRLKWSVGQAGALQGLNWAPQRGVLFQGDPNLCQPSRASSKSKPQGFCLENLTRKTQKPSAGRWCSCKGGSSRPWLFEELLETGVSMRKSFQDKKPGRSSGFGRGFGFFQGQSHKPSAFFCSTSSPPSPPWVLLSGWELRSSERSRHSHIQEPLSWRLHVHTQARKEPAGNLAAPSTPGRALSAQLAPGTLHSASS